MNQNNCLVILVGEDQSRLDTLEAHFRSVGRECARYRTLPEAEEACSEPFRQPLVVLAESILLQNAYQRAQFRQFCSRCITIISLLDADVMAVTRYFRLGVTDVLCPEALDIDYAKTLKRVEERGEYRERNERYRRELEKTNHELQESLRLLKQDQMAGLEVQKNLMPEGPLRFGDYEIAHSIVPSLYLSGDFVGYNLVLDRYLLFYFADVSGHGASSAFVTVLLRFMIGRVIRRHINLKQYDELRRAPEGLIEHINHQILATGLGKHLTIFAGSLDRETNCMRYVVGAQLPQPILVVDGNASFLPGSGKPIGIFEDAIWVVYEHQMPANCALVLLSDGILDLLPEKSLVEKEKFLLRQLSRSSLSIESIKEALSIDYEDEPQDDISILLLTRGN